jgi:hypothetical protein
MRRSVQPLQVVVTNKSTRVDDADAKKMTEAVAKQVKQDFSPAWAIPANSVTFQPSDAASPAGGAVLTIVDNPDQPGVLGWHTEGEDATIFGYVFASPVLDNGGEVLSGATYTVAATLSHEVLETIADPHVNLWATGPEGYVVSQEVCDPVENGSYDIDGVSVSNFVTPAWFDAQASAGTKLDHLGQVSKPFEIASGGYYVHFKGGKPTQVFGEDVPEWRRNTKSNAKSRGGHLLCLASAVGV